jgi:hypothetical protein
MTRKQSWPLQLVFADVAAVVALALFTTGAFATDDNFVNDNGQTSGDIFQQNAQSQSP